MDLPESIQEVKDDILEEAIECLEDRKLFKIIPQELAFYRKQNIPLPRMCPDCRHYSRKKLINPRKLWERACAKCGVEMETTYAPNRPEIVYCEKCYSQAIY